MEIKVLFASKEYSCHNYGRWILNFWLDGAAAIVKINALILFQIKADKSKLA